MSTGTPESSPVVLPAMSDAQTASWFALMELHEHLDHGWTLGGGQLVHLHCAERGIYPPRPTEDIDAVVDVRADPVMLARFTGILSSLGFEALTIGDGVQHRWIRDKAQVDVLIPEGTGERTAARPGVAGAPTIATPGGTQALRRSEALQVGIAGRTGAVRRPRLASALIMKAAAHTVPADIHRARHRQDFACLTALVAARDFRDETLNSKDRKRLRDMVEAVRQDEGAMSVDGASDGVDRLTRAAKLI